MVLRIKQRTKIPKKVLVYGLDGSGKSTFAENYCNQKGLKAVCLDVDDTNFTNIPIVEFNRSNHIKVKEQVLTFINDVKKSDEFDTVIIDGVSSLLNLLVSDGKGQNKYGDRTVALNKIINELAKSKQNFILIGQIDLDTNKDDVSVAVVNVNSIVNEKYLTYISDKGEYLFERQKYRAVDDLDKIEAEAFADEKPAINKKQASFETANIYKKEIDVAEHNANRIITQLEHEGFDVTLLNAKKLLFKLMKRGEFKEDCQEIMQKLEVLLNGSNS